MKRSKICTDCRYCHPYYGNKNKQGKRVISTYWCSKKNRKLNKNLKQCDEKMKKYNG